MCSPTRAHELAAFPAQFPVKLSTSLLVGLIAVAGLAGGCSLSGRPNPNDDNDLKALCAPDAAIGPDQGPELGSDLGLAAAPLYNGNPSPTTLQLTSAERLAVVAVVVDPGPAEGMCTGTLVAHGWVLTAAHCASFRDIEVRFGPDMHAPLLKLEVARSHLHPEHPDMDVALLQLPDAGLTRRLGAEPIRMWPEGISASWVGDRVEIAGRGLTLDNDVGDLLFVDEPVTGVDRNTITVDGEGESGACVGDSGGPLLVADGAPFVAGTLSEGDASCLADDHYIRIDRVRSWVLETLGEHTLPDTDPCADHPGMAAAP